MFSIWKMLVSQRIEKDEIEFCEKSSIPCRYYHIYDKCNSLNMQILLTLITYVHDGCFKARKVNNCILTIRSATHVNNYNSDLMFTFVLFCFTEAL